MLARSAQTSIQLMRTLALTLVLAPLSTSLLVAQSANVEITVTDDKGKPLTGVKVTLTAADGAQVEGETIKKGRYKTSVPEGGAYKLRLEKEGFGYREVDLNLPPGQETTATLQMLDADLARKQEAIDNFNEAVGLLQGNNADGALEKFQKVTELDPSIADAHRLVAALLHGQGKLAEALEPLETYLGMAGMNPPDVGAIAYDVFRAAGDTARANEAKAVAKGAGLGGDLAIKVFNEGVGQARSGDKAGAIETFNEALDLDPQLSAVHRSIAALHFNDEEFEEALASLAKLTAMKPDSKEAWRLTFFSNTSLNNEAAAIEAGKRWLALDANAAGEVLTQAADAFKRDDRGTAGFLLKTWLGVDPNNAQAHYELGKVYLGGSNTLEAKEHLQKFLELDPSHAEAAAAKEMLEGLR